MSENNKDFTIKDKRRFSENASADAAADDGFEVGRRLEDLARVGLAPADAYVRIFDRFDHGFRRSLLAALDKGNAGRRQSFFFFRAGNVWCGAGMHDYIGHSSSSSMLMILRL